MNLNQAPHPKYYCRDKPEEIYHRYKPSSGAAIVNDSTWIDSRIINAANSGIQVDCEVFVTNWRIYFHLIASGIEQFVDIFYDEICIIGADGDYFSSDYGVKIGDTSNNFIILKPTRPHFLAVELYALIALQIINGNAGLLNIFSPKLSRISTNTIKVPNDFASVMGDKYIKVHLSIGFCFPINLSPYLNGSTYTYGPNQFLLGGAVANIQSSSSVSKNSLQSTNPIKVFSSPSESGSLVSTADISSPLKTLDAVKSGSIAVAAGEIPQFSPSLAAVPAGFSSNGSNESDLLYAIANPLVGFQSFFNDLNVLGMAGINDDMINLPCFDEDVYCKLVIEMHRYTLAQVIDQKDEIARKNANLGTVVGGLLSVFTLNPLAMFFGRNVGHSISDKGKRVDEFLPNPQLLFYQDENSYLSWNRAQVSSSRLRRLIIARQVKDNGMVYFRLIPAMVTPHQILPMQLFCFNSNLYFYRPFSAGIEPRQTNYDAERIQRLYTHSRLGESTRTEIELSIFGRVVDPYPYKLDRFVSQRLDYFYADFETQPGSIF